MLIKLLNVVPNSLSIVIIDIRDHNSEPLKGCKSSNIKLFSAQFRIFSINLNIRQIRIVHSFIIPGNRLSCILIKEMSCILIKEMFSVNLPSLICENMILVEKTVSF